MADGGENKLVYAVSLLELYFGHVCLFPFKFTVIIQFELLLQNFNTVPQLSFDPVFNVLLCQDLNFSLEYLIFLLEIDDFEPFFRESYLAKQSPW